MAATGAAEVTGATAIPPFDPYVPEFGHIRCV